MSCNDRAIADKLNDYFSGHLSGDVLDRVENHLDSCENCRATLKTMKIVGGKVDNPGSDDSEQHVAGDLLSLYYQDKSGLSADQITKVETHLKDCDTCAYDLAFLQDMETDLSRSVQAEMVKPSLLHMVGRALLGVALKPALAYFLLLLTIYPAARYVMGPDGDPTIPGSPFPSEVYQLSDLTRAGGEYPQIFRSWDNNLVRISVPFYHAKEEFEYIVKLENEDQTRDYHIEKLSDFSKEGSIGLILNTVDLSDGTYLLDVYEIDWKYPFDTAVTTYPFELRSEYRPEDR